MGPELKPCPREVQNDVFQVTHGPVRNHITRRLPIFPFPPRWVSNKDWPPCGILKQALRVWIIRGGGGEHWASLNKVCADFKKLNGKIRNLLAHWGCSTSIGIADFFFSVSPIALSNLLLWHNVTKEWLSQLSQEIHNSPTRMVSFPQPSQGRHV